MIAHLDEYVAMLGIAVLLDDSKKAKGVTASNHQFLGSIKSRV